MLIIDTGLAIGLAIIASIAWGVNAFFIKFGMKDQNPMFALFIRALFASPILILIAYLMDADLSIYFEGTTLIIVIVSSILIIIGDGLFMLTLKKYEVSLVQPIVSIYPLVTTIILIITKIEVIGLFVMIGTPVLIIGVAVVSSSKGDGGVNFELKGMIMALTVALFWGTTIFTVRYILLIPGTEAIGLTGIRVAQIGIGALIAYLFTRKSDSEETEIFNKKSWMYMGISGILGFVIGASALFLSIQSIGAGIATPISSTNPVVSVSIGMMFGWELKDMRKIVGTILSVIGTIIIIL